MNHKIQETIVEKFDVWVTPYRGYVLVPTGGSFLLTDMQVKASFRFEDKSGFSFLLVDERLFDEPFRRLCSSRNVFARYERVAKPRFGEPAWMRANNVAEI